MNCKQCGKTREIKKFYAYRKCRNCEGKSHFMKMCRAKQYKLKKTIIQNINAIVEDDNFYIV